ncbi:glycoside hydrolase family 16 protein [Streptomyces oceani]|uniref:1,3-beta-glucanase n=1 Tax=Streptomyces oceani TaxID=1075402 RepID=A0A1E7KGQ0_9ACTN|nr:glycoside hydrolase family 16 protein [Streptomyces oceani]OEV03108.1 1,3-beta-glucanase [Streptomyces oceani]
MSMKLRRSRVLAVVAAVLALGSGALATAQADQPDQSSSATAAADRPAEQTTDRSADGAALEEVWRADFDGAAGSPPAERNWIIDTGTSYPGGPPNWGTGEVQTYTDKPENLQLDGQGRLKITALKDGDTWTSGRIETQRTDFAAPEGGTMRIEASIRVPDISGDAALGYWPAFWTLGADYRGNYQNWPGVGEFDIMENVNGLNTVWGVLHCGVNPGGPCKESQGLGNSRPCPETACQAGFHTYALELDRSGGTEELRWSVDGQQYHSVSEADVGAQAWADATHHGHFILLNLAMGGAFPDGVAGHATPTEATKPGASMLVDHVSVAVSGGQTKGARK